MRYLSVRNGVLIPASVIVDIDTTKYTVVEERRRFMVSQHEKGEKFLIDVGFRDNEQVTIICEGTGELIHALALVRTAFPMTGKRK